MVDARAQIKQYLELNQDYTEAYQSKKNAYNVNVLNGILASEMRVLKRADTLLTEANANATQYVQGYTTPDLLQKANKVISDSAKMLPYIQDAYNVAEISITYNNVYEQVKVALPSQTNARASILKKFIQVSNAKTERNKALLSHSNNVLNRLSGGKTKTKTRKNKTRKN